MKHIKLFEGFDTDEYFQYIDNDDYWGNFYLRVEMSSNTIKVVTELFKDWDIDVDDYNDVISVSNENIPNKNYRYSINLYEVDDEYFYVNATRYYPNGGTFEYSYKCDQLDGLSEFLKNEYIIK